MTEFEAEGQPHYRNPSMAIFHSGNVPFNTILSFEPFGSFERSTGRGNGYVSKLSVKRSVRACSDGHDGSEHSSSSYPSQATVHIKSPTSLHARFSKFLLQSSPCRLLITFNYYEESRRSTSPKLKGLRMLQLWLSRSPRVLSASSSG